MNDPVHGDRGPSTADQTLLGDGEARPDSLEAGAVLAGRYELRGLLGVGGMGSVYRAWDSELDELVALKMLRHGDFEGRLVARFRKEVKLARSVTHRNVARTFDIGEHGSERFLTMELIDGVALDALIAKQAPLPLADARAILIQICEGLAAAHEVQVVHRDLKPANVMLESTGRIVVTDFGLARRAEVDGHTVGVAGQVLGTPAYMAPEQVAGIVEIDARADVYALGLIAHELLLGRAAWCGSSPLHVAAARLYEDPPDFAGVVAPLRELLCRCVAREREQRFTDAGELLVRLRDDGNSVASVALLNTATATLRARETRVAVLPFAQGRGEALIDGLAEDLADVLSMTPGLRVRHAALCDARAPSDPIAVGRELGVEVVVSGSVRRLGDQLRVSVRVHGTSDGYQLWAGRFDRRVEEALALNDEVAAAVAEVLVTQAPEPRTGPADPQAVELYLLARKFAANSYMQRGRQHIDLLDRALSLAPDDPLLTGMWVFSRMAGRNFESFSVAPEVEAAVAKLAISAPSLPGTHLARAAVATYGHDDRAGGVVWVRRGLALAPNNVDLLYLLAVANLEADRLEAADEIVGRGLWVDPSLPWLRATKAMILGLQSRWDELVEHVDHDSSSGSLRARTMILLRAQMWAGRELASIDLRAIDEPLFVAIATAQQQVFDGRAELDGLRRTLAAQMQQVPRDSRGHRMAAQLWAEIMVVGGAPDDALALITTAADAGLSDAAWFELPRIWDSLRADPRFVAARARVSSRASAIAQALDQQL